MSTDLGFAQRNFYIEKFQFLFENYHFGPKYLNLKNLKNQIKNVILEK